MDSDTVPPCYLCGATSFKRRPGHCRDNTAIFPEECTSCGLVRLSSQNHISQNFYADSHMHDDIPCDPTLSSIQSEADCHRRINQFSSLISNSNLLDFGCGDGAFLLEARKIAASVTGIEPEKRLQHFFSNHQLNVYKNIDALPKDSKYDIITMFHVLEHLPDPLPVLQRLHKFLQIPSLGQQHCTKRVCAREREREQNAHLIIEVPNANDVLLTLYENEAFSNFTYWSCHLYLYTENTLAKLAEKAGFKTVEILQFQRYPIANHLYWLAKGMPCGQSIWKIFNHSELMNAYENILKREKKTDTLIGIFTP